MINYPNQILYKAEELLNVATSRYTVTIQVARRAKHRKYEEIDIVDEIMKPKTIISKQFSQIKPIIRAILEMVDEV
uniref:DNA-directed RNA polymerase omega subunit n=1 Tax=Timspurckia oligopyrenoides TaxID=708627 RepID=UPI001FCD08FA|nr:DNA-directed RNA polymerase omega subunit [Timspurckia oligopyrenoides]UNJ17569.1 DNA-directed RNA polymerase omega subunit [Timspurckia oligopyrenoides]